MTQKGTARSVVRVVPFVVDVLGGIGEKPVEFLKSLDKLRQKR